MITPGDGRQLAIALANCRRATTQVQDALETAFDSRVIDAANTHESRQYCQLFSYVLGRWPTDQERQIMLTDE